MIVLSRTITFVKHAELFIRNEYQQCQGMKLWFLGLVRGFVERFNLDELTGILVKLNIEFKY